MPLFRKFYEDVDARYPDAAPRILASEALRRVLNAFVTDLMREVCARVREAGITTLDDVRRAPRRLAALSPEMESERAQTKKFLYESLYNSPGMEEVHRHSERIIKGLFARFMADPLLLPEDHRALIAGEGLARTVTDYIAGMTDGFIEQIWEQESA